MKKLLPVLLLALIVSCASAPYVKIGDTKVTVELAITPEEKAKGLMYREYLAEDRGMLFVFEEEKAPSFWMKNTLIPLDMIFINSENKIVDILLAEPCKKDPCRSYTPKADAKYVLEVNAGFSERHNANIGDEVSIKT
ncbi:MAG: DUF192 domain-containing protein [Candidatus Woesearchaeota archaeon]